MRKSSKTFYLFAGIHSFLIGLFLFFVPVFLWNQGFNLSIISSFVSLMGIGYLGTLWIWDRIRKNLSFSQAVTLSLVSEIATLACIFTLSTSWGWVLLGFMNGVYNGLFWTLQRTLFLETITDKNSGRKYGNFQIFVFLILKGAILFGSFLLEKSGFSTIFITSFLVGSIGVLITRKNTKEKEWKIIQSQDILSLKNILKSPKRESFIFFLDGPFLFLESFLWSISLFWILDENFLTLGLLAITLSLFFSISFWIVKNIIDHIKTFKNHIYGLAVTLYALSWFGRSLVSESLKNTTLFLLLFGIMFGTSFFRLLFNKQFFDNAQKRDHHHYIYRKSYYSQASIVLFFGILAGIFVSVSEPTKSLPAIYLVAGLCSVLYLFYKPHSTEKKSTSL